jgi:hypothetical protein
MLTDHMHTEDPGAATCGRGLAGNAALPARLGNLAAAMAEVLEQHTRALDLADPDGRLELLAYASLARAYRDVANDLVGLAQQMAGYRDMPMAPHDLAVMTDPNGQAAAFQRVIAVERDLLELLRTKVEQDEAMVRGGTG